MNLLSLILLVIFTCLSLSSLCCLASSPPNASYALSLDPARLVRFDGIGAISGGGATSVYLRAYPEPARSLILDYLFLPNFGASLHMLKVELGGDAQSTDGAESSYMHGPWASDFHTGYEWWLMKEAKRRNPHILLYALPWAFPQWVSCAKGTLDNCTGDPYAEPEQTAGYVTGWVRGASKVHGLSIDYVGLWNERRYNTTYILALRRALDAEGFSETRIVAADGDWGIAEAVQESGEVAAAVYALGAHYPGTESSAQAKQTGKPLWASEDCSTYSNQVGAGCWARILNKNFVNGGMRCSINWNLLSAYPKGTHWYRAGMMDALQPWSGSFGTTLPGVGWTAGPMLWATYVSFFL